MKMLLVIALKVIKLRHYRQLCQHSVHTEGTVGIKANTLLGIPVRHLVKETL